MDRLSKRNVVLNTDLFKLMNSEDTPGVPAVRSDLLSEACRHTGVPDWQLGGAYPLVSVVGSDRLF